jgi:hypothetical protein
MLRFLRRSAGEDIFLRSWFTRRSEDLLPRKWRLFLAACCNRVAPLVGGRARRLIEFANSFTDHAPGEDDVERVNYWFGPGSSKQRIRLLWGLTAPLSSAAGELRNIAGHYARHAAPDKAAMDPAQRIALGAEAAAQSELIRVIIGNPFPVSHAEPGVAADGKC